MIGQADFTKGVVALWRSSGLDAKFSSLWDESASRTGEFRVLSDSEAAPGTPFPYCVFEISEPQTTSKSSGKHVDRRQREYRNQSLTFNIHARDSASTPAKNLAAELMEEVAAVFGGHPTKIPSEIELEHGAPIVCQYLRDYGVRTGTQEYQWVIQYSVDLDVPVKIE